MRFAKAVLVLVLFLIIPEVCFSGNHGFSNLRLGVAEETVDMIELNHFYCLKGIHVYDQVIFWNRDRAAGKYHVRAWCLVEDRESLNRRPLKNYETGLYHVDWLDTDHDLLRKIKSRIYKESWSQVDPERIDKLFLEDKYRLSLIKNPKKNQKLRQEYAQGLEE